MFCLFCAALLTACGSPGVPMPPSLELARPVSNLRAARKGDKVTLTWSAPTETTDQHNIRHSGVTEICRAAAQMKECGTPIARIAPQKKSTNKAQSAALETYIDQLPSSLQLQNPLGNLFYAILVLNSYARSAGLSNQTQVPAAPTLPPPSNLQSQVTAEGIQLTWTAASNPPEISGLHFVYRVYRQETGTHTEIVAGEVPVANQPAPSFLDRDIEWEKTYVYRLSIATLVSESNGSEQQVEGDDSPPITVFAHDVFPPATPTGLQAVFSGPGQKPAIDLVWSPDTDADLAGYNVFRHEEGMPPAKINTQLVKSPAFVDTNVAAGHTYFYSVSAVDVRGNESAHSEEASETVP